MSTEMANFIPMSMSVLILTSLYLTSNIGTMTEAILSGNCPE